MPDISAFVRLLLREKQGPCGLVFSRTLPGGLDKAYSPLAAMCWPLASNHLPKYLDNVERRLTFVSSFLFCFQGVGRFCASLNDFCTNSDFSVLKSGLACKW